MNIIDGKEIAKNLRSKIAEEVSSLDRPPGLAVILVGEDPASAVYVRNKELACKQAGFFSDKIIKSENITEEQLLEEVERLNNNPHIDGILVNFLYLSILMPIKSLNIFPLIRMLMAFIVKILESKCRISLI